MPIPKPRTAAEELAYIQRSLNPALSQIDDLERLKAAVVGDAVTELQRSVNPTISEFERLKAIYGGSSVYDEIQRHTQSMADARAVLGTMPPLYRPEPAPPVELSRPPPNFSNTPMHRAASAAEETAEHIAQVADLTAKMVSDMSALTESIVNKALPEWKLQQQSAQEAANRSLQQSQTDANRSFKQANTSLIVAAVALVASVIVTIAVAWWQVDVTKTLAVETAAQQAIADKEQTAIFEATQKALQDQLSAQRELIEQQRNDSEALLAALAALKPPPPVLPQPTKK